MVDFQTKIERTGRPIDTRWRAQSHGENVAVPGQLDPTKFVSGTHYNLGGRNDNVVPSGVALYRLANGLYGPYDPDGGADADAIERVLAGYINDNEGVELGASPSSAKPTCAVLKHGVINHTVLPVTGQRASAPTAKTTGAFVYVTN